LNPVYKNVLIPRFTVPKSQATSAKVSRVPMGFLTGLARKQKTPEFMLEHHGFLRFPLAIRPCAPYLYA
jgi:hypothetical protein